MVIEMEAKIKDVIEHKIRPLFQKTGGDVEFKEYKDGIVIVNLQCPVGGCPCLSGTLKNEVEKLLKDEIPEIKGVELQK